MSDPFTLRDVLDEIGMARDLSASADRAISHRMWSEAVGFRGASDRAMARAQRMLRDHMAALEDAEARAAAAAEQMVIDAVIRDVRPPTIGPNDLN